MKKIYFVILIVLLTCVQIAFSQTRNISAPVTIQYTIDSLNGIAKNAPTQQKVEIYYRIARMYDNIDPYKTIEYGEQALSLSKTSNNQKGMAIAYNAVGNGYRLIGDYEIALTYFFSSLKIYETFDEKESIARILTNIGMTYTQLRNHTKSIEYHMRAASIFSELQKTNQNIKVSISYLAIANSYSIAKNHQKQLEFGYKALDAAKKEKDLSTQAHVLESLGLCYFKLGQYQKALEYYKQAFEIYKKEGSNIAMARCSTKIGVVYQNINNFTESRKYLILADTLAKLSNSKELLKSLYNAWSFFYSDQKNYKQALLYYKMYKEISDSIFSEQKSNQVANLEIRYETEKKQKEIMLLTRENQLNELRASRAQILNYGIAGLALMMFVIGLLFIRQNKLKTEQQTVALQQKLLRSQMNPHFIFHALANIQNFIYKNEPNIAAKYLTSFAKLIRLILENSRQEYVSLEKEINTIQHYMELQALDLGEKLKYTLDVDPSIDLEAIAVPPMLAQPFIENAIEHGIKNQEGEGVINIRFVFKKPFILFEVTDNGVGLKASEGIKQQEKNKHQSLATSITQERLTLLNKKVKQKITIHYEDQKREQAHARGTKVIFTIPYKELL